MAKLVASLDAALAEIKMLNESLKQYPELVGDSARRMLTMSTSNLTATRSSVSPNSSATKA